MNNAYGNYNGVYVNNNNTQELQIFANDRDSKITNLDTITGYSTMNGGMDLIIN